MKLSQYLILLLVLTWIDSSAQQMPGMEGMNMDTMKDMETMPMDMHHSMSSSYSRNVSMNRDGSGTSWQPDESPMMMYMLMKKQTTLMWHGAVFPRLTVQDVFRKGSRGGTQFDAPNWLMFMINQNTGKKGVFNFTSMFSLDFLTESNRGYPLLFQSGESYNGVPLVDRQHPHDLFSALSVAYTYDFTPDLGLTAYFGYPGEPALGVGAFMHRLSAAYMADAPISHHWQDATHIAFGVATLGFRYKFMKIEGSIFTGREPNEVRYDFDKPRFDSYSYRLSFNPISSLSIQASQGFIHSPEALEPDKNVLRTTASLMYTRRLKKNNFIASTLAWGFNHQSDKTNYHSIMLEGTLRIKRVAPYLRYEWVQKDPFELQIPPVNAIDIYNMHALALGVNTVLVQYLKTELSIGSQVTVNIPDSQLKSFYGNAPVALQVFLRLAPAIHN